MRNVHGCADPRTLDAASASSDRPIPEHHHRRNECLEFEIRRAMFAMLTATDIHSRMLAWDEMRKGILARSPDHVYQRERELGLEVVR